MYHLIIHFKLLSKWGCLSILCVCDNIRVSIPLHNTSLAGINSFLSCCNACRAASVSNFSIILCVLYIHVSCMSAMEISCMYMYMYKGQLWWCVLYTQWPSVYAVLIIVCILLFMFLIIIIVRSVLVLDVLWNKMMSCGMKLTFGKCLVNTCT